MRIAILDDNLDDLQLLQGYLEQYQKDNQIEFEISPYHSGLDLLEEYEKGFDVVFLDIEMPGMNGMEVAKEIRKTDESVAIIFVTSMAQYAISGYEVNAIDFMVKPIGYFNFAQKLQKAIRFFEKRKEKELLLSGEDGITKIHMSDIYYIEKEKNYLIYHTSKGKFAERGTMQMLRTKFPQTVFAECITGCLVNLRRVQKVGKESVFVEGKELPMSRRLKKEFIHSYVDYIGGTDSWRV